MPNEEKSPNYAFWDNLVGQDHRAFWAEDSRPIPVYLFTNCMNNCDVFILGASLGFELYRQVKEGLAAVKRVPSAECPERLCHQVISFYGQYKDVECEVDSEDESTPAEMEAAVTAYAAQIISYFGEDSAEQERGAPRKAYKGLMSKKNPQSGPSLEMSEINDCEAPSGFRNSANEGPVWLYLVKPLPEDHANIALEILSGEAFDSWQTDSDQGSNEDADE